MGKITLFEHNEYHRAGARETYKKIKDLKQLIDADKEGSKKIIGIIVAVIVIVAIAIVIVLGLGKENLEEVKLPLQIETLERTVSVTVGYPKNKGITVEGTDSESAKTFKNKEKNYSLELTLQEDTTYQDNKEYAMEEENYEEIKVGDYSGYVVKGEHDIDGSILLEDASDQNVSVYLTFDLEAIESYIDGNWVDLKPIYNTDEIQTILKSIKYDKGENTSSETKKSIDDKKEEAKTSNYGEFASRSRTEGTSDKDGLIFIPSFESPKPELYRAEQRNDNVGVDNNLWYTAENSSYNASGIEVRIFPKSESYESMEEYIEKKGDMYHWSKQTIAGKEYDTYTFGSNSSIATKYSKYYNGAFMVGNKVIEFSYNIYAEVPDQDLGDEFFNNIINSIEYSKKMEK